MSPKRKHKAAVHHGEENQDVREREVLGTEKSKALIGFHNFDHADWVVSLIEYVYLSSKFLCCKPTLQTIISE